MVQSLVAKARDVIVYSISLVIPPNTSLRHSADERLSNRHSADERLSDYRRWHVKSENHVTY